MRESERDLVHSPYGQQRAVQEPGASSGSPTGVQGCEGLSLLPLHSQAVVRELGSLQVEAYLSMSQCRSLSCSHFTKNFRPEALQIKIKYWSDITQKLQSLKV